MKTICIMRDVYKALAQFETAFYQEYNLSLNEAMVLCCLEEAGCEITSTTIAERTEMGTSHTSKTLRSVEEKGLIQRSMGQTDKRQMYFSLTPAGKARLQELSLEKIEIPKQLRGIIRED
ncbi:MULTISPECIES: winged helix DNA-binding protein [Bacteroides]|uniref:winged helix DNA-binding protein n=1 Tax=Bacteroides TaxID=816 RepID=UPI0005A633EA|nr:winged helix DNA-binding protein [Bacteroides neonati]